jgi:Flp pilus assembly protein protease CpaA
MISYYLKNELRFYAMLSIASLCLNILIQILLIFALTRGIKEKRVSNFLFQSALVVTFVKPGWDAHQVATGAVQPPGATFDALAMMTGSKTVAMFSEDIPVSTGV